MYFYTKKDLDCKGTMLDEFLKYVSKVVGSDFRQRRYLLAVSGGVDSMSMLHLSIQSRLDIKVVTVDHHTRSGESTSDAIFVKRFCEHLGIQCYVVDYRHTAGSFQQNASEFRKYSFETLRKQTQSDYICTAHHADDHAETLLMLIGRSAGFSGLASQGNPKGRYFRMLGFTHKSSITSYAKEHDITYREDLSNRQTDYLRNALRLEVLPTLNEAIPKWTEKASKTLHYLSEAYDLHLYMLRQMPWYNEHPNEIGFALNMKLLQSLNMVVESIYRAYLTPMGFTNDQLGNMVYCTTGAQFDAKEYIALRNRDWVMVRRKDSFVSKPKPIQVRDQHQLVKLGYKNEDTTNLDHFPYTLRLATEGDMWQKSDGSTKLLSRHLTDLKMNRWAKKEAIVLVNNAGLVEEIMDFGPWGNWPNDITTL